MKGVGLEKKQHGKNPEQIKELYSEATISQYFGKFSINVQLG